MIREIHYGPIFYSKLKYPRIAGDVEGLLDCSSKGKKERNILSLHIKTTYLFKELYGSKTYQILKSYADCEIVTDGLLTPLELYEPYKVLMDNLIQTLQTLEIEKGLPQTKTLTSTPFEFLKDKLQVTVDHFCAI